MSDDGWTWDELPFARAGLLLEYRELKQQRDALRAEVERLRALIKRARPYVQAYAAITRTDEVSLDASETAEAMRLSDPTTGSR